MKYYRQEEIFLILEIAKNRKIKHENGDIDYNILYFEYLRMNGLPYIPDSMQYNTLFNAIGRLTSIGRTARYLKEHDMI